MYICIVNIFVTSFHLNEQPTYKQYIKKNQY